MLTPQSLEEPAVALARLLSRGWLLFDAASQAGVYEFVCLFVLKELLHRDNFAAFDLDHLLTSGLLRPKSEKVELRSMRVAIAMSFLIHVLVGSLLDDVY